MTNSNIEIIDIVPFECNSIVNDKNEINFKITKKGYIRFKIKRDLQWIDKEITIPVKFICDLSSIPKLFQPIFPKEIEALKIAGGFHDFIYRNIIKERLTRKEADELFKQILIWFHFDFYEPNFNGLFIIDRLKWFVFCFFSFCFGLYNSDIFYYIVRIFGKKYYVK